MISLLIASAACLFGFLAISYFWFTLHMDVVFQLGLWQAVTMIKMDTKVDLCMTVKTCRAWGAEIRIAKPALVLGLIKVLTSMDSMVSNRSAKASTDGWRGGSREVN